MGFAVFLTILGDAVRGVVSMVELVVDGVDCSFCGGSL